MTVVQLRAQWPKGITVSYSVVPNAIRVLLGNNGVVGLGYYFIVLKIGNTTAIAILNSACIIWPEAMNPSIRECAPAE